MNDFLRNLNDMMDSISNLNNLIIAIATRQQNFQQNPSSAIVDDINKMQQQIKKYYNMSRTQIKEIVTIIDQTLNQNNPHDETKQGYVLPNKDKVDQMMQDFFKSPIKTRPAPIPPSCGCYAYKNKTPNPGNFVCAQYNGTFILMIVLHFEDSIVTVFDPTDTDGGIKPIKLGNDDWTPLPLFIPEKPLRRWEFTKGTTVLSLWLNGEEWTTAFYKATVKLGPFDRIDCEDRGYQLDFGDNNIINVPEKFVVYYPESWPK